MSHHFSFDSLGNPSLLNRAALPGRDPTSERFFAMSQTTPEPDLSLPEMLRVMDVARALRKERETVERAFSRDEERAFLRKRLMETAQVTGDEMTEKEIDAAIDHYYTTLHAFKPPPLGFATFLAHLWVLRRTILVVGTLLLVVTVTCWGLFWADFAPFSRVGQLNRNLVESMNAIDRHLASIKSIAEEKADLAEAEKMREQANQSFQAKSLAALETIRNQAEELDEQLSESYEIRIVGNDGRQSAFEGVMTDDSGSRAAGYFVIVEARDKNGHVLTQAIRDAESGQTKSVAIWAERVPQSVYDRLKTDKLSDGILDETLFAVKNRGQRTTEVLLKDQDGQPITRGIQMTDWEN